MHLAVAGSRARTGITARLLALRHWDEVASVPGARRSVSALVREAGNPYWDWLFGGVAQAQAALERWLDRPSSELFGPRIAVAVREARVAGIVLAVRGVDLDVCRKADTLAALVEAGEDRPAFLNRMTAARRLFLPVREDSLYLSRIAVAPRLRGRGLGRWLLDECLRRGREAGFRRFELDVSGENESAVRLYRSFGFRVEATRRAAGMRYVRMVLIDDWPYCVAGEAAAGEVLVSRAVRDLVAGSGLEFEDRGTTELEGIPGSWELFAVRRESAR